MSRLARLALWLAALSAAAPACAHRLSPGFFGFRETSPNTFAVQWKVSISGGLASVLEPKVPEGCTVSGSVRTYVVDDVRFQHATLDCTGGLAGKTFTVSGLPVTQTDVLLRVEYLDGAVSTQRLTPGEPSVVIPIRPRALDTVQTYLGLGVEHILLGVDHLLFVLALVLLVRDGKRLLITVTAFTVAHSVTLAAATLGFVHVPSAPVEAVIALSILFVAAELIRENPLVGHDTSRASDLMLRAPWVVAFAFGLLHGFGFAGALSEVGVPAKAVPLALLFFNVGVEVGQLLFIGAVLALGWAVHRLLRGEPRALRHVVAYGIGSAAGFWTVERTLAIF